MATSPLLRVNPSALRRAEKLALRYVGLRRPSAAGHLRRVTPAAILNDAIALGLVALEREALAIEIVRSVASIEERP